MKCPKCNEELKEGTKFCSNCGNEIEQEKEDKSWNGLMLGCSAIVAALILLSINSKFSLIQFFITYLAIFVAVYLCVGIIYIMCRLFFKKKEKKNKK